MIEDCCKKAGGGVEKYLFKAVTEGKILCCPESSISSILLFTRQSKIAKFSSPLMRR